MCTIIFAHQLLDEAPVFFAANRDERLDRPAAPPERIQEGPIPVLAPRDLEGGGTWLGINAEGVLAAITNRFGATIDADRRSRGELPFEALRHPSAAEAAEHLRQLDATEYNGFHLLVADTDHAYLVSSDAHFLSSTRLDPGLIIVTERSLGAADNARKKRLFARCRQLLDADEFSEATLQTLLSECDRGSIDATCIRLPELNYGTRSASIIRLNSSPRFLHAEGPPCEAEWDDLTEDLLLLF